MTRRILGAGALALVVLLAGCGGLFGGIPDEQLCEEATYDWDTDAAATYNVTANGEYKAVYNLSGTETLELFQTDGLGNDRPVRISAVQFRAPNGTTYGCEDITVRTTRRRTIVELPAPEGQFAYTARSSPKRFTTRTFVNGSHEVILPPDREVSNPLFGSVQPSGYEIDRSGERLRITWAEVKGNRVAVRYYLERDIPIFFGVVLVAGALATVGIAYYYRLIQRLQRRREEAGLDVDIDDESGRDPPPGFG